MSARDGPRAVSTGSTPRPNLRESVPLPAAPAAWPRAIAHIDMDARAAAVEQRAPRVPRAIVGADPRGRGAVPPRARDR